jgi:hypothetical protein
MELATLALKCVPPLHRGWHGVAAARHWPHVHRVIRPIVHAWHRAATGPVIRSLASAQAACRYMPLAAGIAAGGAVLPGAITPPAQPLVAHTTMVAAPAISAALVSAMVGDSGSGGFDDGGFPTANAGAQALPAAASSPEASVSPSSPFVPPSQPTVPDLPVQSVPEAPSVAMLLSGVALLALTKRLGRPGG